MSHSYLSILAHAPSPYQHGSLGSDTREPAYAEDLTAVHLAVVLAVGQQISAARWSHSAQLEQCETASRSSLMATDAVMQSSVVSRTRCFTVNRSHQLPLAVYTYSHLSYVYEELVISVALVTVSAANAINSSSSSIEIWYTFHYMMDWKGGGVLMKPSFLRNLLL